MRRRMSKPVVESVCGHDILVLPEVFNPVVFRTGRFFAEFLNTEFLESADHGPLSILDLGTGSGVLAIICASFGHKVTATDLNPTAVQCADLNVAQNGFRNLIETRYGDLFEPIAGEQFDLILWNPPFFDGEPETRFELSWRSTDAIDRFAANMSSHLNLNGRALLVWSSQSPENVLADRFAAYDGSLRVLKEAHFGVEHLSIYEILPNSQPASTGETKSTRI